MVALNPLYESKPNIIFPNIACVSVTLTLRPSLVYISEIHKRKQSTMNNQA